MWDDAQYGAQHRLNTDMSFTVLKNFHVTPSASYEDIWFFKTQDKLFDFDPDSLITFDTLIDPNGVEIIVPDTISYGTINNVTNYGFTPFRRFSTGVSITTQIYGTKEFTKGWLRGIRHIIKPSVSFNFTPDLFDSFRDSVQFDVRRPDDYQYFSILESGVYSAGFPTQPGDQMAIGYSFNNIFEAKYFSKKDSTEKKLKLFDNIIVSGNYNFAADSLNFSPLNINGTTRFFGGATTFGFSATYDFYEINQETGRRLDQYYWEKPGQLLRFDNLQARLTTRLTIRKIKELFEPKETQGNRSDDTQAKGGSRGQSQNRQTQADNRFFSLFDDFSIDHNLGVMRNGRLDTTIITTHTINMRGAVKLTKKWSITVGNIGYDFRGKELTYPDFGFVRDLHCWAISMSWQPQRGTYSLRIGVKPGSLDFIKIPHNRNLTDTFGGF
jgi:hypothetical protein